jgi:uncharacterized protein
VESISVWWFAYPALGAFAGFLGGLFGIGGGLVIVPILYMVFTAQHFPHAHLMHLALGTSMASIVFTSIASTHAHHRLANVDWRIFRAMGPGLAIGSVGGSLLASRIPTAPLALIFTAIVLYASVQLMLDFKPAATRQLPCDVAQFAVGLLIGVAAGLSAASGGFLAIPYLVWHNVVMKRAIGTSASTGVPVAVSGAAVFLVSGVGATGMPPLSIGYVNLPALIGVAVFTMLFVQFGARLASRMDVGRLKRVYGAYLLILAVKMLHSSLS